MPAICVMSRSVIASCELWGIDPPMEIQDEVEVVKALATKWKFDHGHGLNNETESVRLPKIIPNWVSKRDRPFGDTNDFQEAWEDFPGL